MDPTERDMHVHQKTARVFIAAPFIIARNYWETIQMSINSRTAFSLILANPYDRILCSNEYMSHGYIHMNYISYMVEQMKPKTEEGMLYNSIYIKI